MWLPRKATHRVANPSAHVTRNLEIAYGTFDEDDIERLEGDCSR